MMRYTRRFDELAGTDRPLVGGKCASLGELVRAGLPVPDGFAVTVDAFEDHRDTGDLRAELRAVVRGADPTSSADLDRAYRRAVELITSGPLPAEIESGIRAAYAELAGAAAARRGGVAADRIAVAVRSSSIDEDGDAASFAGQQETYLWVVGADEVLEKVRECWASMYSPQAIAYRSDLDDAEAMHASKISVAVQLMAVADVAGVTFTVSPRTGDRSVIAINASWGLGQAVVSGEVTPDEYWLTKVGPAITSRRIADKLAECVPADGGVGVVMREVEEARRSIPCLTDDEVLALAAIGLRVEEHHGCPQDIEWAIERNGDGGSTVMLLQARPETNWKKRRDEQKKRKAATGGLGGLMGYVATASKAGNA